MHHWHQSDQCGHYFRIIGKLPTPTGSADDRLTRLRSSLFKAFRTERFSYLFQSIESTYVSIKVQVQVRDVYGRPIEGITEVDVPIDLPMTEQTAPTAILSSIEPALSRRSGTLKLASKEPRIVNSYLTTFRTAREKLLNDKIQLVSQCNNGGLPGAELEVDDHRQIVCRPVILRTRAS
jgi:hypothetical protein